MAEAAPVGAQCVLLVEDDPTVAQMYRLRLEMDGYLVLTAIDGETGLSMAERFRPDIIILDIGLPGMNGLELLDAMRASDHARDTPVLILTNFEDPEAEKRSLELGARQFLRKSKTTPDALTASVRRSIGGGDTPA
jgi:DNA-binding response OmpR family regulator